MVMNELPGLLGCSVHCAAESITKPKQGAAVRNQLVSFPTRLSECEAELITAVFDDLPDASTGSRHVHNHPALKFPYLVIASGMVG